MPRDELGLDRDALDRHITGNWGADFERPEEEEEFTSCRRPGRYGCQACDACDRAADEAYERMMDRGD